jgi:hypothetical protein
LLAIGSTIPVILAALKLRAKLKTVQNQPLFNAPQSLAIQQAHLAKAAADAGPLAKRAKAALQSIRQSAQQSRLPEARRALEDAGADLRDLYSDLR